MPTSPGSEPKAVSGADIRAALDRALHGQEFRSSKRCHDFLAYVVENVLQGKSDTLKERTIAIDVFGCGDDYDPGGNAIVRVRAGELRKRLERYYAHEGSEDPLRIVLSPGTYVPEFHARDQNLGPEIEKPQAPPANLWAKRFDPAAFRILLAATCIIVAAIALVLVFPKLHGQTALERFWAPLMRSRAPIQICVASEPVYSLKHDPLSSKLLPEFAPDQYVPVSDVNAATRVSALLTTMRHSSSLRIGNRFTFDGIRDQPTVLIGYTYTRWSALNNRLRYSIRADDEPVGILDYGKNTNWKLAALPDSSSPTEDYALVSRVFDSDTHAMLVEIAGITRFGTEAAAELATNAEFMEEALRRAHFGWGDKDVQIVLHVKVIDGTPSAPEVLAVHIW